jgi:hypothetical protein
VDESRRTELTPVRITTTMPGEVAVLLRGALYAELGRACEDAPATVPECKTRAGWAPVLSRINSALAGLSAIGWVEPDEQEPITIALDAALIEGLGGRRRAMGMGLRTGENRIGRGPRSRSTPRSHDQPFPRESE